MARQAEYTKPGAVAPWPPDWDEIVLRLLASGLVELADRVETGHRDYDEEGDAHDPCVAARGPGGLRWSLVGLGMGAVPLFEPLGRAPAIRPEVAEAILALRHVLVVPSDH